MSLNIAKYDAKNAEPTHILPASTIALLFSLLRNRQLTTINIFDLMRMFAYTVGSILIGSQKHIDVTEEKKGN